MTVHQRPQVKICGLSTPETVKAAVEVGANFIGFVLYPPSPRAVTLGQAQILGALCPASVTRVALVVDPTDEDIRAISQSGAFDMIQLHGEETPDRVAEVKTLSGLPVMIAIRVGGPEDLKNIADYEATADWLLFDSKPKNEALPGGSGKSFNWDLLRSTKFSKKWMLSGGLNAENIGEALTAFRPDAVDVSSGVESRRGVKDEKQIKAFIARVKSA